MEPALARDVRLPEFPVLSRAAEAGEPSKLEAEATGSTTPAHRATERKDPDTADARSEPGDGQAPNRVRPDELRNVSSPSGDQLTIGDTLLDRRRRHAARLIHTDVRRPSTDPRRAAAFPRAGFSAQMERIVTDEIIRTAFRQRR